jgi:hypothetical protein
MKKNPRFLCGLLPLFFSVVVAAAQMPLPDSTEGDFKIANFPFQSGETTLAALTVHYTTFGKPVKDAAGKTTNAILIMHRTTGNGHNFINQLFAVNSADDEVNPPELGIMEKEIKNVVKGKYILLPITDQTSGHGTHSNPTIWGDYLQQLLTLSK